MEKEKVVKLEGLSAFLMNLINQKYAPGLEGLKNRFVAVINAINRVID